MGIMIMIIPPLYSPHHGGSNGGQIIKIDKNVEYLLYRGISFYVLIGNSTYYNVDICIISSLNNR